MADVTGYDLESLCETIESYEPHMAAGGGIGVTICTNELVPDDVIAQMVIDADQAGFTTSYPTSSIVDGVPTTYFEMTMKKQPASTSVGIQTGQLALILGFLGPVLLGGAIIWGVTRIKSVVTALLPLVIVVGVVVVAVVIVLAKPAEKVATAYIQSPKQKLLPETTPRFLPSTIPLEKETDTQDADTPLNKANVKYKLLLLKACEYDRIDPNVYPRMFTKDNPYMIEMIEAGESYFRMLDPRETEIGYVVRALWEKACQYEKLDPNKCLYKDRETLFSKNNPHIPALNKAVERASRYYKLTRGEFNPKVTPAYFTTNPPSPIVENGLTYGIHTTFEKRMDADEEVSLAKQSGSHRKGDKYIIKPWEGGYVIYAHYENQLHPDTRKQWRPEDVEILIMGEIEEGEVPTIKVYEKKTGKKLLDITTDDFSTDEESVLNYLNSLSTSTIQLSQEQIAKVYDRLKAEHTYNAGEEEIIKAITSAENELKKIAVSTDIKYNRQHLIEMAYDVLHPEKFNADTDSPLSTSIQSRAYPGEKIITGYLGSKEAGRMIIVEKPESVFINMILTEPEFRGKGVGGLMMLEAVKIAKSVNKPLLTGSLTGGGTGLIRDLEREGYIKTHMPSPQEDKISPEFPMSMLVIEPGNKFEEAFVPETIPNAKRFGATDVYIAYSPHNFSYAVFDKENEAELYNTALLNLGYDSKIYAEQFHGTITFRVQYHAKEGDVLDLDAEERYVEPTSVDNSIEQSMNEEQDAALYYKKRAKFALSQNPPDMKTAELFNHIVSEECCDKGSHHYELAERLDQMPKQEYVADSAEYMAETIKNTGWREKIDQAFQEATQRVKGK
jgi:GNAT superfamily N-acetyltransferase